MAISVDTVYKTVLLILNKEQRGYMTPDEFNKIGSQVQREIFEAYFEDLNQQLRIPQSDVEYSDRVAITDEKIAEFKKEATATSTGANTFTLPTDLYRLGSVTFEPANKLPVEIQRIGRAEFYNIVKSPLTTPTVSQPIYLYEDNKLIVSPNSITSKVKVQYVKKPEDIRWGYYIGSLGQLINDPTVYGNDLLNTNGNLFGSITTQTSGATQGTYTGTVGVTPGFSTSGSGTGANITVTINSAGEALSIVINTQGSGYSVGDTITVSTIVTGGSNLVITLQNTDFNSGSTFGTIDFNLHNSERTEAILKILLYQGVVIRDPQIVQVAAQKVQQEEVNEKS
tara:strand:+ start:529 stop:1548 length:1020 start_codon:yes stop_codon:yes gene_type:complete